MSEENRIDNSFDKLDETHGKTQSIRDKLIDKFTDIVMDSDFDLTDCTSEDRESFMSVTNGLAHMLNDQEKSALNEVKISLQLRKDDDEHDSSEKITALLHMINPSLAEATKNNPDIDDSKAEVAFTESGEEITSGELEEVGG